MKLLPSLFRPYLLILTWFVAAQGFSLGARASAFPSPGTYRGWMTPKPSSDGQTQAKVPIRIELTYADALSKSSDDDLFPFKRAMETSLVVENEGGPYSFGKTTFIFESGKIEMDYYRGGISPTLKFQGSLKDGDRLAGNVVANSGKIGTFDVQKESNEGLAATSFYAGTYEGKINYTTPPATYPLKIKVGKNNLSVTNPADFALDFTPGYAGAMILGSWEAVAQYIVIDYFSHTLQLTHKEISGTSLTFAGKVTNEGFSGTATSSFTGTVGYFSTKRISK